MQLFSRLEESVTGRDLATPSDIDLQPITESVDKELVLCVCVFGSREGVLVHSSPPTQTVAGEEWSKQQARQREAMEKGDLLQ